MQSVAVEIIIEHAFIPLMLERRWGLGRLLFVGTGPTAHLDVLARNGWDDQITETGIRALRQMDGWHVADLQRLGPFRTLVRPQGKCLAVPTSHDRCHQDLGSAAYVTEQEASQQRPPDSPTSRGGQA